MESNLIYAVTNYDYDGCGSSWEGIYSYHRSHENAVERIRKIVAGDSEFILTTDKDTSWPVALSKSSGQYAYEKYYIQEIDLED